MDVEDIKKKFGCATLHPIKRGTSINGKLAGIYVFNAIETIWKKILVLFIILFYNAK